MSRSKFFFKIFFPAFFLIFSACSSENDVYQRARGIKFKFDYLPELLSGHYEAFLINGREYLSLGKFIVNQDGQMFQSKGNKKISGNKLYPPGKTEENTDIKYYDSLIINIRADSDKNKKPGEIIILEADISRELDSSPLTFRSVDLSKIEGIFQLKTPTDTFDDNEVSGIWFEKKAQDGSLSKGLKLPPTPFGWVYESWIIKDFQILSMGKFGDTYGRDFSNEYSGNIEKISFPGEDFLRGLPEGLETPLNLVDGKTKTFITLEPWNGEFDPSGDQPFRFKILEKKIPSNAKTAENIKMESVKNQIPEGEIEFL